MSLSCPTHPSTTSPFSERQIEECHKQTSRRPTLEDVVCNRLKITRLGLAEMRALLKQGKVEEAELIQAKIEEDCYLLQRRLSRRS